MFIEIDQAGGAERLVEPEVFDQFKVVVAGVADDEGAVAAAADRFGTATEGRVFVPIERVRELAGSRAEDPAWSESLAGMVAYAESKGWVDGSGAVRAHVERG